MLRSIPKVIRHGQTVRIHADEKIEIDANSTSIIIDGNLEMEDNSTGSIRADNIILTPRGNLKTHSLSLESKNNIQISGSWSWAGSTDVRCDFFKSTSKSYNKNWLHFRKQIQNIILPDEDAYPNGYVQHTVQQLKDLPEQLEDVSGSVIQGAVSQNY